MGLFLLFKDRADAGSKLAERLRTLQNQEHVLIVGLARGGVAVAHQMAKQLHLPLAAMVVKKLGAPHNEELALGAVTEDGQIFLNEALIAMLDVSQEYIQKERAKMKVLAQEKARFYLQGKASANYAQQTVVLVDDGIATGASVKAAVKSLKAQGVGKLILAVPVASKDSLELLRADFDEVICLHSPTFFEAVSQFYERFAQVSDQEVLGFLQKPI